jgi:hypothetical protein
MIKKLWNKIFNPPSDKRIIQFYTKELEYLQEKGINIKSKWHTLTTIELIELINEYRRRNTNRINTK